MRVLLTLILLASLRVYTFAQVGFSISEVPVFKSQEDSVRFSQLNQSLRQAFAEKASHQQVDSIMQQMRLLTETQIVGYKKVYRGSPGYLPFDSLLRVSDYTGIKNIRLESREFKRFPHKLFLCTNLENLELVNTRVGKLNRLKKFPRLQSIVVLNNAPRHRLRFSKSSTVKHLVIRSNNGEQNPNRYKNLARLEKLDLASCGLTRFPTGLGKNRNLKELSLGMNKIDLEKSEIEVLPTLQKLTLPGNKIESVPAQIQNLPNLKQLTFNNNAIHSVDPAIAKLKQLEELSFYKNKLTSIPEGVFHLEKLREIDLYYNQIERLDTRIALMKNLEVLYLSNNSVISVPESIGTLSNLQELYLSNNRLVELTQSLCTLEKLKVLRINNNQLSQLPKDFTRLVHIENLDISGNQFTEFPEGILQLEHLKLLVMMDNPWDEASRQQLAKIAEQLRQRLVIVHLEAEAE